MDGKSLIKIFVLLALFTLIFNSASFAQQISGYEAKTKNIQLCKHTKRTVGKCPCTHRTKEPLNGKGTQDDTKTKPKSAVNLAATYSFNSADPSKGKSAEDNYDPNIYSVANFNRFYAEESDADLFTIDDQSEPPLECKTCSLHVAPNGASVILKCCNCYQIDTGYQLPQLEYLVSFIEVVNYTDPVNLIPKPKDC